MQLSPLWYPALQTLATSASLDTGLHLLSPGGRPGCATAWKLSRQLARLIAGLALFVSFLGEHRLAWPTISIWKPSFRIFPLGCSCFRQVGKSGLCYSNFTKRERVSQLILILRAGANMEWHEYGPSKQDVFCLSYCINQKKREGIIFIWWKATHFLKCLLVFQILFWRRKKRKPSQLYCNITEPKINYIYFLLTAL